MVGVSNGARTMGGTNYVTLDGGVASFATRPSPEQRQPHDHGRDRRAVHRDGCATLGHQASNATYPRSSPQRPDRRRRQPPRNPGQNTKHPPVLNSSGHGGGQPLLTCLVARHRLICRCAAVMAVLHNSPRHGASSARGDARLIGCCHGEVACSRHSRSAGPVLVVARRAHGLLAKLSRRVVGAWLDSAPEQCCPLFRSICWRRPKSLEAWQLGLWMMVGVAIFLVGDRIVDRRFGDEGVGVDGHHRRLCGRWSARVDDLRDPTRSRHSVSVSFLGAVFVSNIP